MAGIPPAEAPITIICLLCSMFSKSFKATRRYTTLILKKGLSLSQWIIVAPGKGKSNFSASFVLNYCLITYSCKNDVEQIPMEKTIYVVEDDLDISGLIAIILNNAGFQVSAATTVEDFYQLLKIKIPDLILLDIMLPDGNGVEVCKELKQAEAFKYIPVILMSAHAKVNVIASECSADDFIAKPFDIYDLTNKVKVQLAS